MYNIPTMSVRMRHTKQHTANRRSHHALKARKLTTENGVPALRHRASLDTGTYKGRQVIDITSNAPKEEKSEDAKNS